MIPLRRAAEVRPAADVFENQEILRDPAYRAKLSHQGRSRPIFLICETINVCSNDCVFCAYGHQQRDKAVMPMDLFEKVVKDYAAMGGGLLSLTPMVGDIFLDRHLAERLRLIGEHPEIRQTSVTTHATVADRYNPRELADIVRRFDRLHVSVYGLDSEEHRSVTRRDDYQRTVRSIRMLIDAADRPERITLGFRNLRAHAPERFAEWMRDELGRQMPYSEIHSYANWGGSIDTSRPLPMGAQWMEVRTNTEQCLVPLLALQVLVNGDVSFCPCCDYDANPELALGSIRDADLLTLYNSERCRDLWSFEKGHMPDFCARCSFHRPLSELARHDYIFEDPLPFFGG